MLTTDSSCSLGISQFYGLHHLSRFLPTYQRIHPEVKVLIREESSGTLEKLVEKGELDLALVPFPLESSLLEFEVLYREEIFLAVPPGHPLACLYHTTGIQAYPFIDLKKVKDEPFISLYKMRFTERGNDLCAEAGFRPNIRYETRNWDTAHEYVKRNLGISFIPEILISKHRTSIDPVYFRINSEKAFRPYAAIYQDRRRLSEASLHFIEVAQAMFMQKPANQPSARHSNAGL